jgi:hypothetical protein
MPNTRNRGAVTRPRQGDDFTVVQKAENAGRDILDQALQRMRDYAHEKPESAALWCLGIGFVLGWKLKPW